MRKKLVLTALTVCVLFAMTGWAFAGTLHLTASQVSPSGGAALTNTASTKIAYPYEGAKGGDDVISFDTGLLTGAPAAVSTQGTVKRSIVYIPTTDLPSGTRIVWTLTGATWGDTKYYLMKDTSATNFDGVTVASTDSLSGGVATFVVGSTPVNAGTLLILSVSQDTVANTSRDGSNAKVAINVTATGDATVAVTQCYDAVGAIAGGLASAINIINVYQEFSHAVTAKTATIDVESPALRKKFTVVAGSSTATTSWFGTNWTDAKGTNEFFVNLNTASLANFTYTLTGGQLTKLIATSGLQLTDAAGAATAKNFTIGSATSGTLSFASNDHANWYNGTADTITFTVDGTTNTLDTQAFNLATTLTFSDTTSYNSVSNTATLAETWDINGWQSVVPYMWAATTEGEDTFIKIYNKSTIAGNVLADVVNDAGTSVGTNLSLGTVSANTVGIFWARNIAPLTTPAISLPNSFAAVFTVNAPKDSVTAMAVQKRLSGIERVIPIYTGTAGNYKNY
jgi:hypothetical protein